MSGLKNETKKEISQLIFGLYGNILFLKRKYRGQAKSSSGMYCINKDGKQNHLFYKEKKEQKKYRLH